MNHKQISELKVGDVLELKEDYIYSMEWGKAQVFPKGMKMKFIHPVLGAWRFEFDRLQRGYFPLQVSFGRSRLLKLRVKINRPSTPKTKLRKNEK